MVYKPLIPKPTDIISQSQVDMIGNFLTLDDVWGKPNTENVNVGDHIPLTDGNNDNLGGHKKITFIEQSAAPTTLVNELGLYTKNVGSAPEIFYRQESDGDETQLTSLKGISVGGLILRAAVIFDHEGNIVEKDGLNEDGEEIKIPLSYNVTSVTPNTAPVQDKNTRGDWNINFTNNLPTADYMWVYQSLNFPGPSPFTNTVVQAQPFPSATYSDSVSVSRFRAYSTNIPEASKTVTPNGPFFFRLLRMIFQAYTVA